MRTKYVPQGDAGHVRACITPTHHVFLASPLLSVPTRPLALTYRICGHWLAWVVENEKRLRVHTCVRISTRRSSDHPPSLSRPQIDNRFTADKKTNNQYSPHSDPPSQSGSSNPRTFTLIYPFASPRCRRPLVLSCLVLSYRYMATARGGQGRAGVKEGWRWYGIFMRWAGSLSPPLHPHPDRPAWSCEKKKKHNS